MANQKTEQKPNAKPAQASPSAGGGNIAKQIPAAKVINLNPLKCTAEECKTAPDKAGFCQEHFTWFKEGLITVQGSRAKDFDKKYHAWLRRKSA